MPKQEVYHSSTLGPISLSFTGRHLLQQLRDDMTELVAKALEGKAADWEHVSRARGRLAQYMSKLEGKQKPEITYSKRVDFGLPPRHFGFDCGGRIHPQFRDFREETSAEMLERLGTNAHLWAVEFLRKFPRIHPDIADTDEVRSWFANAIQHAIDVTKQTAPEPVVNHIHLPEIPEGYSMEQVGPVTTISPINEISGPSEPQPELSTYERLCEAQKQVAEEVLKATPGQKQELLREANVFLMNTIAKLDKASALL